MKNLLIVGSSWLVAALLAPSAAQANLVDPGTCTTDSMTITRMETPPLDGSGIVYEGVIASTQCFGVNTAGAPANNDDAGGRSSPSPNIGHLGDGFLNGEALAGDPSTALDPYLFINSPGMNDSPSLSTPHNIPGSDSEYDPGWIHLAHVDSNGNISYSTAGTGPDALYIGDLVQLTWECAISGCGSGTWSLDSVPNIVELVQELLGPNSFDHLAISVFQANKLAIYDFDFTILAQPGNELEGLIDFVTPYAFSGTWDMGDFAPQSGSFSHVNFWARDPFIAAVHPVPAPIPLAFVLVGFLYLTRRRRRLHRPL